MLDLGAAQAEMRRSYVGGGPGVLVSGLVWLTAALSAPHLSPALSFAVLFFGGMLIFPLSLLVEHVFFRRPPPSPENKLGQVALESTIAMIGCLFAAYLFLAYNADLVFPVAAIAVGTHYFAFKTVYGDRLFWLLGFLISAAGLFDILSPIALPGGVLLTVAVIEFIFAAVLIAISLNRR